MVHPLKTTGIGVELRAEWALVDVLLGPLIHQCPLQARERHRIAVGLDQVLANLGTDRLEHEAQMPEHRVISQDRVARLQQITGTDCRQHRGKHTPPPADFADTRTPGEQRRGNRKTCKGQESDERGHRLGSSLGFSAWGRKRVKRREV